MVLKVVRITRSKLACGTILWIIVNLSTVLLVFRVDLLADAVNTHYAARHAGLRRELFAVLATLSAVFLARSRRL